MYSKLTIAALLALAVAGSGMAVAGDRHHHDRYYGGHDYGHDRHYKHKKHYRRYYRDGHHSRRHVTKIYRDDDDDLLAGLLVGGIIGYALNEANDRHDHEYYPRAYDSYPRYRETPAAIDSWRNPDTECLQEREYQTTIVVGGREVDGYGTACLQPDGSWKRGPALVANY